MCNPVAGMMAFSAVQGGLNIMGQRAANDAFAHNEELQAAATERAITENRMYATQAYIDNVRQEQLQESQQNESNTERRLDMRRQSMQAAASAKVAAAEAGVGGRSLDAILFDFNRQEATFAGHLLTNQQFENQARQERIHNYGVQREQRSNAIKPYMKRPTKPVDYFSPILGIAGSGMQTAVLTGAFKK